MLETIEFSNEKKIILVCPICHQTWEDNRIKDDPPNTHYAIMSCVDCRGDYDDSIIYYDKYGHVLKVNDE